MKKITTLFVSSLISVIIYGQTGDMREFHRDRQPEFQSPKERISAGVFRAYSNMPHRLLKKAGASQVLDSLTEYRWDEGTADWVEDYKAFYIYNGEGLITEWYNRIWDRTRGTWEPDDRETYAYDGNGNLVLYTDYDLNEQCTEWYSAWKREYSYTGALLTGYLESQQDYEGTYFYPVWKTEFMYDDQERVTGTIEYTHTVSWKESWRTEYRYDERGNLVSYIDYDNSDTDPSGWVYACKEEFEYDQDDHLKLYREFEWNKAAKAWLNSDREEYTFAGNGDVEQYVMYKWDAPGDIWVRSWKEEYTYDGSYSYDQLVLPWFFYDNLPNFFNHMMTGYRTFDYTVNEWENDYMGMYHFSGTSVTGLPGKKPDRISFFPNPAGSTVTFLLHDQPDSYTLEVFDLSGRSLFTRPVRSGQPVDISRLSEGMYLLRVSDREDDQVGSGKIFIRE